MEQVENIPPSIALEQRNHVMNSRSTVATQTEIIDYLRVLYARAGDTFCGHCQSPVKKVDAEVILDQALKWFINKKAALAAPLELSDPSPSPTPKKKTKKTTTKQSKKNPNLLSLFRSLREQGYRRILWKISSRRREILDLEELESDPLFEEIPFDHIQKNKLWVIVDRLRVKNKVDKEIQARLFDSIHQALQVGRGRISFIDLDDSRDQAQKHFQCRFACEKCGEKSIKFQNPAFFLLTIPLEPVRTAAASATLLTLMKTR